MHISPRLRAASPAVAMALVWLLLGSTTPARAQEAAAPEVDVETTAPDEQQLSADELEWAKASGQEKVDLFFGRYLVTPLYKVLFYDFESERWLNVHMLDEVTCSNEECETTFDVAQRWSDEQARAVSKCPECGEELFAAKGTSVPLIILWLLMGAIFFTLRMGFINVRAFRHGIQLVRGRYDNPDEPGELSHFQALASALSATIGLGNIAGVAIAVSIGGPGAIVWMIVAGFLGMSSKFAECTLSQMYRRIGPDGVVSGGPMRYLQDGLRDLKVPGLGLVGLVLAVIFAVFCMGGSFGGGCAFQVSQSKGALWQQLTRVWPEYGECRRVIETQRDPTGALEAAKTQTAEILASNDLAGERGSEPMQSSHARELLDATALSESEAAELKKAVEWWELSQLEPDALAEKEAAFGPGVRFLARYFDWTYGLVMALAVGLVIIGGIRRIAATAEKIVPTMCIIYVLTALYVLAANYEKIPDAISLIFTEAFRWESAYGGLLGVLVMGIRRAAFSNEAGIGSAAIAHAAAKTEEPVREGIVASLGPFIDTIVICTMTGLAIVITGAYNDPAYADLIEAKNGAALTSEAFGGVVSWFPWVLCLAVILFAYSTMISWSYYGERCWAYLFGTRVSIVYRLMFLSFVVLGSVVTANNVLDFSDLMILSMAFPNMLGVGLLSGRVRRKLNDYWGRLKAGEMQPRQG